MKALVDIKNIDREFYDTRLRDFLPDEIIDIHTHVYLKEFKQPVEPLKRRTVTWPSKVAEDNSIEDLMETYRLMLPGKKVTPLIFSSLSREDDFLRGNDYIRESASKQGCPALLFARPEWSAEDLETQLTAGGFFGVKVYLSLSNPDIAVNDITIFDFLPPHQLEVLNRCGLIVMLHLPRNDRLKDPKNLEQLLEIEKTWPDVRLIVAHVGRAYCKGDVGDAFRVLSECRGMMFDISANTNAEVFEQLIHAVGPGRILFGSDMPILRMRMKRVEEDGRYVNVVPRGLYGDVSNDPNMREVDGKEAEQLTFFLYEELSAFKQASDAAGLSLDDIKNVFFKNARVILDTIHKGT